MTFHREAEENLSIDMTPLVDCIFAIILFLLVASSFVDSMEMDLAIDLPTQGKELKVKAAPAKPIVVNVRNMPGNVPDYRVENQSLNLHRLTTNLMTARHYNRDQSVIIRGDRNVKWEHIAAVMSCCADAGITKVSAAVQVDETRK